MKTLYLFTLGYPYGITSETFLETEIDFLSKAFKNITIFPSTISEGQRPLPPNVHVDNSLAEMDFSKKKKIWVAIRYFPFFFQALCDEIAEKGISFFLKTPKAYVVYLLNQLIISARMRNELGKQSSEAIFYDYWFCNVTLALSVLRKQKIIQSLVCRTHGFDLYDDRWPNGVPFRRFKAKNIDRIVCISDYGYNYFNKKTSFNFKQKTCVSRLGVVKHQADSLQAVCESDEKIIVSCSNVIPRKNVQLIPCILKHINKPIHWIHFGDGPSREKVEEAIKLLPDNIKATLKGQVNNSGIIEFYTTHRVDLFLCVSLSEGLPVSFMEALSFNIPIVAYAVDGIPEIVIDGLNGFLIYSLNDLKEAADGIHKALFDYSYNPNKMKEFFNKNYDAEINYDHFIKEVLCR